MTPAIAALVADALAFAESNTPKDTMSHGKPCSRYLRAAGWSVAEQSITRGEEDTHVRLDMHDATSAHLADLLVAEKARTAILVQALRRVRDEAEYARDLRGASYMADKHVTRALIAVGDPDPDAHSGAYVCRREEAKTTDVYKAALEEARQELVELLPAADPDDDWRLRETIGAITTALADEGPQ